MKKEITQKAEKILDLQIMTLLLANMSSTLLAVNKKLAELENELAFRNERIRALRFETHSAIVQLNSLCQTELQRRKACRVGARNHI